MIFGAGRGVRVVADPRVFDQGVAPISISFSIKNSSSQRAQPYGTTAAIWWVADMDLPTC
jgi:hypothetical protein